jgi:hypothetical protein
MGPNKGIHVADRGDRSAREGDCMKEVWEDVGGQQV